MRLTLLAFGVFVLTLAAAHPTTAQQRDKLTGVGPIVVAIESLRSDIRGDGLSEELLRTAVELRLRQNGVPLDEESSNFLYVSVSSLKDRSGLYAYAFNVELRVLVQVVETKRYVAGQIWNVSSVGTVGSDNVNRPGFVRELIS